MVHQLQKASTADKRVNSQIQVNIVIIKFLQEYGHLEALQPYTTRGMQHAQTVVPSGISETSSLFITFATWMNKDRFWSISKFIKHKRIIQPFC